MPSPMATPMPWDLVATDYAHEIVPMFEAYAHDALALAPIQRGTRIVDVACGPGTLSVVAARAGAQVDAIDFSPAMIEQFKRRLAALGIPGVTPRIGDGQSLPYADGVFAAGFSMFGVMFFPDRAKGLAELRRVLAPGARAVISSWTRLEEAPVMFAMFTAVREAMAVLGGPSQSPVELPLTTEDDCRTEMGAAFRDVEVQRVPHVQHYTSAADLWDSLQRTMAPVTLMKKMIGERWPSVSAAASAAIHSVVGGGPVEVTMTALLTTGVA